MKTHFLPAIGGLAFFAASPSARAIVTYTDPFTDGNEDGGTDNSGIAWYDRSANSNLTVDASGGALTGNALNLNLGTGSVSGTSVTNRGFMGVLSSTFTPTTVGDSMSLAFDFQIRATSTNAPATTFTTSPQSAAEGITFGFFSSNGTPVTTNGTTQSDNDRGIRGSFGTGGMSAAGLFREANGAAGGLGTGTAGDSVDFSGSGTTTASAVNDFLKHSAQLTITLSSLGNYTVEMKLDGNTIANAVTPVTGYTSFDEVVFSQGGGNSYSIDNVVVTYVPEPAAALLSSLGLLGILRRRR